MGGGGSFHLLGRRKTSPISLQFVSLCLSPLPLHPSLTQAVSLSLYLAQSLAFPLLSFYQLPFSFPHSLILSISPTVLSHCLKVSGYQCSQVKCPTCTEEMSPTPPSVLVALMAHPPQSNSSRRVSGWLNGPRGVGNGIQG